MEFLRLLHSPRIHAVHISLGPWSLLGTRTSIYVHLNNSNKRAPLASKNVAITDTA